MYYNITCVLMCQYCIWLQRLASAGIPNALRALVLSNQTESFSTSAARKKNETAFCDVSINGQDCGKTVPHGRTGKGKSPAAVRAESVPCWNADVSRMLFCATQECFFFSQRAYSSLNNLPSCDNVSQIVAQFCMGAEYIRIALWIWARDFSCGVF